MGVRHLVGEALHSVFTRELSWLTVGFDNFNLSTAIRFNAVLSNTTTASAFNVNRFKVSNEL